MVKFQKPVNLNGQELRDELRAQGIAISDKRSAISVDENGDLFLEINQKDESKAAGIVANHNGTTMPPEPTLADKLLSVGVNIDDLKSALGLS